MKGWKYSITIAKSKKTFPAKRPASSFIHFLSLLLFSILYYFNIRFYLLELLEWRITFKTIEAINPIVI